jgi:hypothetical protein
MNELIELEKQLRSWVPRRPSARLKERLFAKAHVPVAAETLPALRFNWVAPAAAALLLMGVLFNQRNIPAFSGSAGSGAMVALVLSNQSAAAWLPGSFAADRNNVPAESFEWTNGSSSPSSIGSHSSLRGNN